MPGLTIVGDDPFARKVPPHEPVYQLAVPPVPGLPPEAISCIVAGKEDEQLLVGVAVTVVGATEGTAITATVTEAQVVVLQSPA